MWVLVTILMHQGNIKVNSFNGVFMERASCVQLGARIEEELMKTRPTPESIAKSYCFSDSRASIIRFMKGELYG